MKFIYFSDIHGDVEKFEKVLKLAIEKNIENIVFGGDLFPKRPEIRESTQKEFINGYLKEFYGKLQKNDIKFIGILGNDDLEIVEEEYYTMIKDFSNVIDIDGKKADIENVSFIGLSKVLDTPFKRKNRIVVENGQEMPEQFSDKIYVKGNFISIDEWAEMRKTTVPKMEDCLENLPKPTEGSKAIYVLHDPPYGIGLDYCKDGSKPGSKAITKFLENSNAYMSLHGHIHESQKFSGVWNGKIGNTICIQAGQTEFGELPLHYVIVDTEQNTYEIGYEN